MLKLHTPYTRTRKRKCLPSNNTSSCKFCVIKGFNCSLHESHPKLFALIDQNTIQHIETDTSHADRTRGHSSEVSTSQEDIMAADEPLQLPDKQVVFELVDLYFRLIHNVVHTMFHEHSCISDIQHEMLPPMVSFAIIALSAR